MVNTKRTTSEDTDVNFSLSSGAFQYYLKPLGQQEPGRRLTNPKAPLVPVIEEEFPESKLKQPTRRQDIIALKPQVEAPYNPKGKILRSVTPEMEASTPIFEEAQQNKPRHLKVSQGPVNFLKNQITEAVDDASRDD